MLLGTGVARTPASILAMELPISICTDLYIYYFNLALCRSWRVWQSGDSAYASRPFAGLSGIIRLLGTACDSKYSSMSEHVTADGEHSNMASSTNSIRHPSMAGTNSKLSSGKIATTAVQHSKH